MNESEWSIFEPNYNVPYSVIVFNDENKHFEKLENTWF